MRGNAGWMCGIIATSALGCGQGAVLPNPEQKKAQQQEAEQKQIDHLVEEARQATKGGRHEEAVKKLEEALRVRERGPEVREQLREAREVSKKARKEAYEKAMRNGHEAGRRGDHPLAAAAFREALGHLPEDSEAKVALADAEFRVASARGRRAPDTNQYADAISALEVALRLRPEDAESQGLLHRARAERRSKLIEEGKKAQRTEKYNEAVKAFAAAQKLGEDSELTSLLTNAKFEVSRQRGREQLHEGNFAGAVASLEEAVRLKPEGSSDAAALLKQARDKKAAKDQADYEKAMAAGRTALDGRNFHGAITAFKEALNKKPSDPQATVKLDEARKGQDKLDSARAIKEGDEAFGRKDWQGAISAYSRALDKKAGDGVASIKLADARAKKAKKDSYDRHIRSGKSALSSRAFSSAESEFRAALSDLPGDSEASRGLSEAQRGKTKKASYDRHISSGKSALSSKNYSTAESEFRAALSDLPGDSEASRGLSEAQRGKAQPRRR